MSKTDFQFIPLAKIRESKLNPRQTYDQVKIEELAASIKSVGMIEPMVLRKDSAYYEIVAGSRRYRAAKLAELEQVPAMVRDLTDAEMLEIMVIENNQREGVTPLEEAEGYARLLTHKYTLANLAEKIGRSHRYIYDRLKLRELVPQAKEHLAAGRITAAHAILLARLKPEQQKRAMDPSTGGLLQAEQGLWNHWGGPDEPKGKDKFAGMKAKSTKELQAWIDEHVMFDKNPNVEVNQELFPDTVSAVNKAAEEKEKVVQVTHNFSSAGAREGTERIYHSSSWRKADGSSKLVPKCELSVTGVVVLGAERGAAFKVCVNKECKVHWPPQKKPKVSEFQEAQAKKYAAEAARRDAEYKRQELERQNWKKAAPAIVEACVEKLKVAKLGVFAEVLDRQVIAKQARGMLPKAKTSEDLLRLATLSVLIREITQWGAEKEFPPRARRLGVDVTEILKKEKGDGQPSNKDV